MSNRLKLFSGVMVMALMLGGLTLAASAQSVSHTLTISRQAKVGGQLIQPGKYSVAYDEKKDGDLMITRDGKEVLKAAYKRVELNAMPSDSAVIFAAASDGGYKVRRIEIKGSKTALVFE